MIHRQYACCHIKETDNPNWQVLDTRNLIGWPISFHYYFCARGQVPKVLISYLSSWCHFDCQGDSRRCGFFLNETSHLKEILCHSVIFKLTAFYSPISLRKRKEFSFSPPTATLTGKDIHLCLNAWGKQKCKIVSLFFKWTCLTSENIKCFGTGKTWTSMGSGRTMETPHTQTL